MWGGRAGSAPSPPTVRARLHHPSGPAAVLSGGLSLKAQSQHLWPRLSSPRVGGRSRSGSADGTAGCGQDRGVCGPCPALLPGRPPLAAPGFLSGLPWPERSERRGPCPGTCPRRPGALSSSGQPRNSRFPQACRPHEVLKNEVQLGRHARPEWEPLLELRAAPSLLQAHGYTTESRHRDPLLCGRSRFPDKHQRVRPTLEGAAGLWSRGLTSLPQPVGDQLPTLPAGMWPRHRSDGCALMSVCL